MSKTAAAYIRVSTERQDEYSPDSQIKLIREYAKKNDIELPEEYIFFDDGISAKSAQKRTQFNHMIALAKEKNPPFSVILVWKFSRFARNQEESIVYKNLLRKKGIQVISISEPIIDSPFGELIERIIEWMDEYYLINLSTEVKRGMAEKLTRGEALVPPAFGYNIVDGKYIINSEEAAVVKSVFNEYLNNTPVRQIALNLAAKGVKNHRGNSIDYRSVKYMLENPVYNGKIRWTIDGRGSKSRYRDNSQNVQIVDGIHQAIISDEVWEATQQKLFEQKKMYGRYQRADQPVEWMLKGLMRCDCGATLTYAALKCPSMQCHEYAKGRGKCVTSHSISINKANRLIIEALENLVITKKFQFVAPQTSRDTIDYDALIAHEKVKLTRAKDAYLAGIDTVEEYKANKTRITKAIESLQQQQAEAAPTDIDVDEFSERVREVLKTIKDSEQTEKVKNEALRTIISHIIFHKPQNQLVIHFHI